MKYGIQHPLLFILSLIAPLTINYAQAADILILDDDYGTEVADDLTSAGHTVTSLPYYDWEGDNPNLSAFDVVILLNGYEYGYELGNDENSPAYAALEGFIRSGGTFASTEWVIYDMDDDVKLGLDPILPADYTSYVDYNYSGTYTVLQNDHPLAAGLPTTWDAADDADGGGCTDLKPGAITVISRSMDNDPTGDCLTAYALAYLNIGQGVSIHLNSDLGHEDDVDATPQLLQILRNVATFRGEGASPVAVPMMSAAMLALFAALLVILASRTRRGQLSTLDR